MPHRLVDLGRTQRFAKGDQPSDPTVTGSIGPAASAPRLTLTAAVAAGQPAAQYELATRYADGRGVNRDLQQARLLFEKAAQQNLAPAQFRLGAIFERGMGTDRDLQKAHDYYLRAANQGNIRAMHNLAVLSAEGVDGKPDYATAANWFQKAAEYGVRDSQYNLAILLARGLGAEQNLKSSWIWFSLAAAQGDADAEKKRDEVGARLNPKDLAEARGLYAAFRSKAPVSAVNDVQAPAGGWDQASPARTESRNETLAPSVKAPARGKVTSL
jgi:localization factor PodJL